MNTHTANTNANAKIAVLQTCVAGLLERNPDEIETNTPLSELFADTPAKFKVIWAVFPELTERRLRISGEWTLVSLALEWQKTEVNH